MGEVEMVCQMLRNSMLYCMGIFQVSKMDGRGVGGD